MYCPNCAAPIEGTKFCRSCGANVSLVPMALTGELEAESGKGRKGHKGEKTPSVDSAMVNIFTGIGFLFVSLAVWRFAPAGPIWWFWLLIPTFSMIGSGIGQYLKARELERRRLQHLSSPGYQPMPEYTPPAAISPGRQPEESSAPTTSELKGPGSITEETTRHLESGKQQAE